jgi:acetyltransferase
VGGLLLVGLFGGYAIRFAEELKFQEEDAAHQMGKFVKKYRKPIVVHSLYNFLKPHAHELLRYYNIPVYDSLEVACKCMESLCQYGEYLTSYHREVSFVINERKKANNEAEKIIATALSEGRDALLENEAKKILSLHKAPVLNEQIAKSPKEAAEIFKKLNCKVAMKIVSKDILHKSDAGGVKLNISNEQDAEKAFNEIVKNAKAYKPDADISGVLITPMARDGLEIIVGTKIDEQFGPIIMFGIGGILVEIIKDVSFRVLPLSRGCAKRMIEEIKSAKILDGFRGYKPFDKKALTKLLLTVSDIIESYPEIREMDLNPIILYEEGEGLDIVDARIILKS